MKTTLHAFELSSLVRRLNFEIQEHIIDSVGASAGPAHVVGWNKIGESECLEICSETKMIEVRSIVVPAHIIDSAHYSIPLSGARLEVVGAWRVDSDRPWMRNHCFGHEGTLDFSLPSFEPEHIKAAATTLAEKIGAYLDTQLETC